MDYIFTQLLSFRLRLEPTFYRESLILYPFCQMAETSLYGAILKLKIKYQNVKFRYSPAGE